jgi:hypothetical protein
MALFRKFFYRKPPDGLLEITERVYGAFTPSNPSTLSMPVSISQGNALCVVV